MEFLRKDNLSDESIKKSIDKLKRVYEMYCSESKSVFDRYCFKNPGIKATGIAKTHVSLTADEYHKILNLEIKDERLDSVRNIFVFLCNTTTSRSVRSWEKPLENRYTTSADRELAEMRKKYHG